MLFSATAFAQIQSPEQFLGYKLGEKFTPHHKIVRYFEHLASDSRLKLVPYGESYENRPLFLAIIASTENQQKLEEIRLNNLKITGLENGSPSDQQPVIVWLSYNVHGNESVSSESVMATAYELLAAKEFATQEWLKNTVVILDICVNPDGRERYVNWYYQMLGKYPNFSLDAREHHENNPNGRYNHYLFDMNRDWAWQSQQETKARVAVYQKWFPHIHVDFHEMGHEAPYYFAPAAQPYHEEITEFQRNFQVEIGKNHAKYFDKNSWLYFTKETYDLFYPSYGDTWPIFNGSIGMTYEQGGSGYAGLGLITRTGDTLSLADRMEHHHFTGLSTVEVSSKNSENILKSYKNYFDKNRQNPSGTYQSFVIKNTNGKDKIKELATYLDQQNIRYAYAAATGVGKGFNYSTSNTENYKIEAKDLIINTNQPKSVLIKVLFNPKTNFSDSLTYDATAWALPYSMALEAYASPTRIAVSGQKVSFDTEFVEIKEKPYAYIAEWKSWQDARFLAEILKAGIKPRYSETEFSIQKQNFGRGTVLILRTDNKNMPNFDEKVQEIAQQLDQKLWASPTGFVDSGSDFGSEKVHFIQKPNVLLLTGENMSSTSFGGYWHFFDQQLEYPTTVVQSKEFASINLKNYNTLVVAEGYRNLLDSRSSDRLQNWIREGGKLIVVGNSLDLFTGFSLETLDEKTPEKIPQLSYGDRERNELSNNVEGAIYKVFLDNTHPLAYGMSSTYFSLRRTNKIYNLLKSGWNIGALTEKPHIDGFVGYKVKQKIDSAELINLPKSTQKVRNVLVFGTENIGRGSVIYLTDDPIFRASWWAGRQILCNALFMVGQE